MKKNNIKKNTDEKKEVSKKNKNYNGLLSILPLTILVFLLPFIIRLKPIPLEGVFYSYGTGERINADFFTYYKQLFIYLITVWSLINVFLFCKKIKFTKAYYFMGVYAALVILSSILSKYPQIALHGFTERKEGMWVVLCYILLMFCAINLIDTAKKVKIVIHAIGISGLIISIIAGFQYYGMDIFAYEWGQKLIIPKSILETTSDFTIKLGEKYSYSVFYNPNYLGGYMSLYVPLMLGYGIIQKNTSEKLYFALLSIAGLLATVFSRSEAGILGISVALATMLIIFVARKLVMDKSPEEYKNILLTKLTPIILIPILLVVSLSYFPMEMNPLERIRKEAINLVMLSDYVPLTKETGPINEIKQLDDGAVLIEIDKKPLNISIQENNIVQIKDESNTVLINASLSELATLALPPDKYGTVQFIITPANDKKGAGLNLYYLHPNRQIKLYLVTDGKLLRVSDSKYKIIENQDIAPSIGFKGKVNVASGRGYIWSRSIPIMLKYPVIGSGQDTYITLFPNQDIFGRQQERQFYYWKMWSITDKPHSTYLQIGIQSGLLSLIIVLAGLLILLNKSFKNIILSDEHLDSNIISFGILGFMISSIFNDSIIAITPIVYILLGINVVGLIKVKNKKVDS